MDPPEQGMPPKARPLLGRGRDPRASSTAPICITVGRRPFEDGLRLTRSFGWTGARVPGPCPAAMSAAWVSTSFAFMSVWMPLSVCRTSSGK